MDIKKFKMFESPDSIRMFSDDLKRNIISYYDRSGAIPFAWMPLKLGGVKLPRKKDDVILVNSIDEILYQADFNNLWVGEYREGHSTDCKFLKSSSKVTCSYGELIHKGRLWVEDIDHTPIKAISFWDIRYIDADEMVLCLNSLKEETGIDFENEGWSIDDPFINNSKHEEYNDNSSTILTPIKEWYKKKRPTVIKQDLTKPKYTYNQDIKAKRDFYAKKGLGDSLVIKKFGDFLK